MEVEVVVIKMNDARQQKSGTSLLKYIPLAFCRFHHSLSKLTFSQRQQTQAETFLSRVRQKQPALGLSHQELAHPGYRLNSRT
jgi:hypothetical protein